MGQSKGFSTGSDVFKRCNCCGTTWESREDFVEDPRIELIGYQANFNDLELGFLLFNHEPCGSSLALMVGIFKDLYGGPIYEERATGGQECPGHCLKEACLDKCGARCECTYVREIISIVKEHHL